MRTTNRFVVCTSAVCAAWVLFYVVLGAVDPGRSSYAQLTAKILEDGKGGVPVINIAVPILIAGSVASLFWKLPSRSQLPSSLRDASRHMILLPSWGHRWFHKIFYVDGDWNMDVWAVSLILLPSVVFVSMTIYRHMHGKELDLDDQLSITSNAFGFVGEVVGSILLIPVARHSPILKVVGWSPARAVRIHIWAGRIFIMAVLIHGGMHIFRWMGLSNELLMTMIIPPAACWTWDDEQYTSVQPNCFDEDTDCTCYARFRNLTGFGAAVALLILLITSMHQVRRKSYRLFYLSHIIAAPLALLLVALHWNRSILYMAPSLLCYAGTSIPTLLESRLQCRRQAGTKVVAVECIPSASKMKKEADCEADVQYISLTFEATTTAMQQFQPGYYVQLLAPEISSISHPFTVNIVPGEDKQLRVIFKVLGKFTTDLSKQLQKVLSRHQKATLPRLHLNGYLGTPNRVAEVLRHDVAVMVAGGIGITPYLSLVHEAQSILSRAPPDSYPTKRIVVLWICRDSTLVNHVKREYMESLLQRQLSSNTDFKIKFVVYHTGEITSFGQSHCDEENIVVKSASGDNKPTPLPFAPSQFAAGSSSRLKNNVLSFLAFSGIAWTGLAAIWFLFVLLQDEKGVTMRLSGVVAIVVVGVVVAVGVNLLAGLSWFQGNQDAVKGASSLTPLLLETADMPDGFVRTSSSMGIELEGMEPVEDFSEYDPESNQPQSSCKVILEEKQGRPSVHEMLNYVDNGRYPGLFTCGPLGLMQDIREHTEERCLLRLQQCMGGASHHIALYEEAFTM